VDKKIVILGSVGVIVLAFLFFANSSNNSVSYPLKPQVVDIKKENKTNLKVENKTPLVVESETKTFNKEVKNSEKNQQKNQNEIIINNEKELDNFVYNHNLNIVSENDKEVIFAKNNPEKSELAPPMVPVIVNYKNNEKNKSIIISGNIAANNNEIYVGEKIDGEVKKLIKIPLKSKKSNQILTPPQIQ